MPIFTRTFQIIAGVLSVPVVGLAVIGSAYQSPFLTHLADIVEGNQTTTVESTNAPNWMIGTPLGAIQNIAATVSSSGSLGTLPNATGFGFQVAAIDVNGGTTTLSTAVTATTNSTGQLMLVTWTPDPGAAAYAVFFGTSSPATLTQYFYATTSSQYVFATSSGSLAGSYTKSDTTAFSTLTNPVGESFIEADNGTATSTPVASTTALQVNGNFSAQSYGTTTNCYAATAGVTFYNTQNSHLWGCNGTTWKLIF
jgi:hypothetical protein